MTTTIAQQLLITDSNPNRVLLGHALGTCEEFYVDATELITGRTLVTSVSGYGKSYLIRLIVERTAGKCLIGIIDIEGEFASLREKFKFFLIIGQDIPIQLETAEFMAEKILEEGLSFIIDLSLIDTETGKQYVRIFYNRLIQLETIQRKPLLTIVEEGDEFAPQGGTASQTCLETIKNLTKKGRKRGMGIIISTQRPAFVSKNVLSQCTKLKLIGRIEWESDLDTLKDFLQVSPTILRHPKDKEGKIVDDGKPHVDSLEPGEFFVSGSIVKNPTFIKVDSVITTHLGGNVQAHVIPAPSELKKVIENLNAALPKILNEKIKPNLPDVTQITIDIEKKLTEKYAEKLKCEVATVEAKHKGKITTLEAENGNLQKRIESLGQQASISAPSSPISDVLEHPIVKNNLEKLGKRDERAKNLVMRIQRDTEAKRYPSREELAAFISASKDTVKNLVDTINETFHATAILGEGKPVQYRSLLQRLYITDVARREIERIEELQQTNGTLKTRVSSLETENYNTKTELTNLRNQLKAYTNPEAVSALKTELTELRDRVKLMATPEAVQALKNRIAGLEAKANEKEKKLASTERERVYFERNFKVLSGLFVEVEKGYMRIQADKKSVAEPKIEEKQAEEAPIAEQQLSAELKEEEAFNANLASIQGIEQNETVDIYTPTPPSEDTKRVDAFLNNMAVNFKKRGIKSQFFSILEVSLATKVSRENVAKACHESDQIEGTQEGIRFKEK